MNRRLLILVAATMTLSWSAQAKTFAGKSLVGVFKIRIIKCDNPECKLGAESGLRFNYFVTNDLKVEDRASGRPVVVYEIGVAKVDRMVSQQWDIAGDELIQTAKFGERGWHIIFSPSGHDKCAIAFEELPREAPTSSELIMADCRVSAGPT